MKYKTKVSWIAHQIESKWWNLENKTSFIEICVYMWNIEWYSMMISDALQFLSWTSKNDSKQNLTESKKCLRFRQISLIELMYVLSNQKLMIRHRQARKKSERSNIEWLQSIEFCVLVKYWMIFKDDFAFFECQNSAWKNASPSNWFCKKDDSRLMSPYLNPLVLQNEICLFFFF